MAEASFWADTATPAEHAAYALAAFNRLRPEGQAAFLRHVGARAGA